MKDMGGRQRGIVAVLVAVGVLPSCDGGPGTRQRPRDLNKSRLQNTVDAAALAAAKVLDKTGSQAQPQPLRAASLT